MSDTQDIQQIGATVITAMGAKAESNDFLT
jgi:hypothetical protein